MTFIPGLVLVSDLALEVVSVLLREPTRLNKLFREGYSPKLPLGKSENTNTGIRLPFILNPSVSKYKDLFREAEQIVQSIDCYLPL